MSLTPLQLDLLTHDFNERINRSRDMFVKNLIEYYRSGSTRNEEKYRSFLRDIVNRATDDPQTFHKMHSLIINLREDKQVYPIVLEPEIYIVDDKVKSDILNRPEHERFLVDC